MMAINTFTRLPWGGKTGDRESGNTFHLWGSPKAMDRLEDTLWDTPGVAGFNRDVTDLISVHFWSGLMWSDVADMCREVFDARYAAH
jgi:hypothetical protein